MNDLHLGDGTEDLTVTPVVSGKDHQAITALKRSADTLLAGPLDSRLKVDIAKKVRLVCGSLNGGAQISNPSVRKDAADLDAMLVGIPAAADTRQKLAALNIL